MPQIETIEINWRKKSIIYAGNGLFVRHESLHFNSLYDCLTLALALGYKWDFRTELCAILHWEKRS